MATLAVISLQQARKSARDAKRIADIKQIQTALELYFNDWQKYPSDLVAGASIAYDSSSVYMAIVPSGPSPADGSCLSSSYNYHQINSGASYVIEFCLGGSTGNLDAGIKCATPTGITSTSTACN